MKIVRFGVLLCCLVTCTALAEEMTTVSIAAPSDAEGNPLWPVLSLDGSQLYDRIYAAAFGVSGMTVELKPVPEKRALMMVRDGQADIFPGDRIERTYEGYRFIPGSYALWYSEGFAAIFKKTTIPNWTSPLSFKGFNFVHTAESDLMAALEGYHDELQEEIANAYEQPQAGRALKMVMLDRMNVYIDSLELLKNVAIPANQDEFKAEEYQIELLGRQKFYPLFQNSERGRKLADLFNRGMEQLARSGELQALYESYDDNTLNHMDPELLKLKE